MRISEVQLDHAFAEVVAAGGKGREWLLEGSRFRRFAGAASLLAEQQAAARTAKHWWKHWWCQLPDGSQSETDIFLVFEHSDGRFALHIENKPPDGTLEMRQAVDYRRRATLKANDSNWLNYSDFETILLAPSEFIRSHKDCAEQFDRCITYEEVGEFAPLFRSALEALAKAK